MSKWYVATKKADFDGIAKEYGIDPVIARIMRNREIYKPEDVKRYLHGTLEEMHSYRLLKDMDKAIAILTEKIKAGKKIRVIGDYDVDGICAAYILQKGLTLCGAVADIAIPDRIKDGYGINEQLIEHAIADGVDTIVTCDNGIAAKEAFVYAKDAGLTCIVTDHHEVVYTEDNGVKTYHIPDIDAVVDPKQEDCKYPYKGICGAFVAYKLIEGMFVAFQIADSNKKELIELAGFATVCDVMELQDENRILVKTALSYMKDSSNLGLKALIQVCKLKDDIQAYHLGFILGPCLNATGRLDSAMISLELLQSPTIEEAIPRATKLLQLNTSRKEMTEQGITEALLYIEKHKLAQDKVLVMFLPDVHESLAGIIAGRVREKYEKPTFVITRSEDGAKGSARSIESYHIYEEMTKCSEYFTKYGGHKMAAGFSMEERNIQPFREKINALCTLTEEDFQEKIVIDVPMPFSYVTQPFIKQLSILEPYGTGNEKPVFAQKNLVFLSGKTMGNGDMARFRVQDETGQEYDLLLFRGLGKFMEYIDGKYGVNSATHLMGEAKDSSQDVPLTLDVLYYPSINEFRGRTSIQFVMQDYR